MCCKHTDQCELSNLKSPDKYTLCFSKVARILSSSRFLYLRTSHHTEINCLICSNQTAYFTSVIIEAIIIFFFPNMSCGEFCEVCIRVGHRISNTVLKILCAEFHIILSWIIWPCKPALTSTPRGKTVSYLWILKIEYLVWRFLYN